MWLDDDTYLDTSPSHSIGEIKLAIVRTTIPKIIPKNIAKGEPIINLASQKVHERSKKAIAHQVKYVASLTFLLHLTFNDDK